MTLEQIDRSNKKIRAQKLLQEAAEIIKTLEENNNKDLIKSIDNDIHDLSFLVEVSFN